MRTELSRIRTKLVRGLTSNNKDAIFYLIFWNISSTCYSKKNSEPFNKLKKCFAFFQQPSWEESPEDNEFSIESWKRLLGLLIDKITLHLLWLASIHRPVVVNMRKHILYWCILKMTFSVCWGWPSTIHFDCQMYCQGVLWTIYILEVGMLVDKERGSLMDKVFKELLNNRIKMYFDNMVIKSALTP